jgi:hypothetical protein
VDATSRSGNAAASAASTTVAIRNATTPEDECTPSAETLARRSRTTLGLGHRRYRYANRFPEKVAEDGKSTRLLRVTFAYV